MSDETKEMSAKEKIYIAIDAYVKDKTGKRIGKSGGRIVFDMVVAAMFEHAVTLGSLRFNAGYGSLKVKTYSAGSRRLPSGTITKFDTRKKLRYEEGVSVAQLIKTGKANVEPTPVPMTSAVDLS